MEEKIKKIIEEFFVKMGIDHSEISVLPQEEETFMVAVKSEDSGILIGSQGEHLKALNFILRRIAGSDEELKEVRFLVDVGGYHEKRTEKIKYSAQISAERAKFLKEEVEMEPMSSYERMIVHSALQGDPEITTESTGVGNGRRVVIKYKSKKDDSEEEF